MPRQDTKCCDELGSCGPTECCRFVPFLDPPIALRMLAGMRRPKRLREVRSRRNRAIGVITFGVVVGSAGAAYASPGVDGTRNLAMGNQSRASATGTAAALINPGGLGMARQFAIEPMYQFATADRTHGMGLVVSDSLNNSRIALALGYLFMKGSPMLEYTRGSGVRQRLELSHFGHEVFGVLGINIVRNWLSLGLKPKFQYTSLRYRDDEGVARDARDRLVAFGLDTGITFNGAGFVRIAVVGENLTGPSKPAWTEADGLSRELKGLDTATDPNIDAGNVRRVSDYQRALAHSLAVYPLGRPNFSINIDAKYDFTSYLSDRNYVRKVVGGSAEFIIIDRIPLRAGGYWDGRGRDKTDDRAYVTGGIGYVMPPKVGGAGVDLGFGFSQQVAGPARYGPDLETVIGINLGISLNPDL